jgi:Ca2+-binding EF-hand superfamily protein
MTGPRPIPVAIAVLVGLFAAGFGVTFLMKPKHAEQHAADENERRPRSMEVDQTLPDWFRNLDRNTDRRVTRAEFVGTDEAFRAIDADLDGAITAAEARTADAWFRQQITGESVTRVVGSGPPTP